MLKWFSKRNSKNLLREEYLYRTSNYCSMLETNLRKGQEKVTFSLEIFDKSKAKLCKILARLRQMTAINEMKYLFSIISVSII